MKNINTISFRILIIVGAFAVVTLVCLMQCKKATMPSAKDKLSPHELSLYQDPQPGDTILTWTSNPTTNRRLINNCLQNTNIRRVILPYHSSGWEVDSSLVFSDDNHILWISGNGSDPGKIYTSSGSFMDTHESLIVISADNCVLNGYSNGIDTLNGRAILEMRQQDYLDSTQYTWSEDRHGIDLRNVDSTTIEGVYIKNTGGDGIYVRSVTTGDLSNNTTIKDIITDYAYRNGISIITANNLNISDSKFLHSIGYLNSENKQVVGDGLDIEPNYNYDVLAGIRITNCVFKDNNNTQVNIGIGDLTGGTSIPNVRFYSCTIEGGVNPLKYGLHFSGLASNGPGSGGTGTGYNPPAFYFQNVTIKNTPNQAVYVHNWVADKLRIAFNRLHVINCGTTGSTPIQFRIMNVGAVEGEVSFQDCDITDSYASRKYLMGKGTTATNSTSKDIIGDIKYHLNYPPDTTKFKPQSWSPDTVNVRVTMNSF